MSAYWSSVLSERVSRRRALAASAGAAATLALSACSSGNSKQDSGGDKSGLVNGRSDETNNAQPGGIFLTAGASTAGSLDPHINSATAAFTDSFSIFSTPLKWGRGVGQMPSPSTITGDAFESWEIAPDGLSITLRLRPNHKFDARPPTNGRSMTIDDVKWSWDRSASLSPVMSEVLNAKGPAGPIESLVTTDDRTAVIKLAFPYGAITELLSFWYFFIAPREAESTLKGEPRGSGPWQLLRHDPQGSGTEYRKNPDWYVKGRPLLDGYQKFSIVEYSAQQAQFETGRLWAMSTGTFTKQEEVLRTKRDHPTMVLRQLATPVRSLPNQVPWYFSQREDSPFKDVRLRQAVRMLYDADSYIEVFYNVKEFTQAGLAFESVLDTHLATQCFNWIDPRNKDFGPNAKYFQYNLTEAKRLIQASGFNGTIEMHGRNAVEPPFNPTTAVLQGMLEAGGLKTKINSLDINTTWQSYKNSGYSGYSGMFQNTAQGYNDDSLLVTKYTPAGRNHLSDKPIPEVTDRVVKIQQELNLERPNAMIKQLTKDLAPLMLDFSPESNQKPYKLHWPWLKNYNVFASLGFDEYNTSARLLAEYWFDKSQKPA